MKRERAGEEQQDEIDGDENKRDEHGRDDGRGTADNAAENLVYEIESVRRPRSK